MRTRNDAGLTRPMLRWPALLLSALGSIAEFQSTACIAGESRADSADALVQAGKQQLRHSDFSAAGGSFARAVALIEQQAGPASLALFEPLVGLADVSVANRQPQAAVENLQRAVAVVRRSAGVYDSSQYPLLMRLADLQSLLGDIDAAAGNLRYMKRVSESEHGKRSLEHGRALTQIADWQCRIGQFEDARRHFRQSIALLDSPGADDGRIDALLGLARCCLQELSKEGIATTQAAFEQYRGPMLRSARLDPDSPAFSFHVSKFMRPEGEAAMRRAVLLTETTQFDVQRQIDVLLQAGDWFQMKDHSRTARSYYARAQAMAVQSGPDQPLAAPVQLLYPLPPLALRYRGMPETATVERFIEMEFVVRADGRADNQRVVERGLGKSAVDEMLSALHAARFRPRIVDGKAVDTEGVRLRQGFRQEATSD